MKTKLNQIIAVEKGIKSRAEKDLTEAVKRTAEIMVELFDVTATKDFANCAARADVEVDGKVLVETAPVTYLLWLEKRLTLIHESLFMHDPLT